LKVIFFIFLYTRRHFGGKLYHATLRRGRLSMSKVGPFFIETCLFLFSFHIHMSLLRCARRTCYFGGNLHYETRAFEYLYSFVMDHAIAEIIFRVHSLSKVLFCAYTWPIWREVPSETPRLIDLTSQRCRSFFFFHIYRSLSTHVFPIIFMRRVEYVIARQRLRMLWVSFVQVSFHIQTSPFTCTGSGVCDRAASAAHAPR